MSNAYGTTEAGAGTFGVHPDGVPKPEIALGYPQPGVEARLVAGDGSDLDEGVLLLRTPATMSGYLNLSEKTRERLSHEGWYDTGDIMRRDRDGFFYFVGRADDMFVCGGENIYPGRGRENAGARPGHPSSLCGPRRRRGTRPEAGRLHCARPRRRRCRADRADSQRLRAKERTPARAPPQRRIPPPELPLAGTNKVDRNTLIERAKAYAEAG